MEFTWDEKDLAFREEVDTFCRENIPPWFRGHFASSDDDEKLFAKDFCKKLGERGWLTMAWPKEYGGADAPVWTQMQFKDMMESHREPRGPQYMNLNWIGPSIMLFGTDEQKQYHLSRMTAGDVVWCQGFSEPDSGSDLASLQTRAVRDGDDYVINGQKIWTSNAESAEFCYLLARTNPDAPKHGGISVFLIPMDTPGLTVRKIRSMVGYGNINEVFLDDVRAPRSTMLGNENEGWHVITAALNFERIGHAAHAVLDDVIDYAKPSDDGAPAAGSDPVLRQKIAEAYVRYRVARVMTYRLASIVATGDDPGPRDSSITSMHTRMTHQRNADLAMEVMGPYARVQTGSPTALYNGILESHWRHSISATIAGGTMEIMREQVAVRGLGLPR